MARGRLALGPPVQGTLTRGWSSAQMRPLCQAAGKVLGHNVLDTKQASRSSLPWEC